MRCLKCKEEVNVLDTRLYEEHRWRRYECLECDTRFSTTTTDAYSDDLTIKMTEEKINNIQ